MARNPPRLDLGQPLFAIAAGQESETLQFIEGGLVYRLPWAMEAIRVRAVANGDTIDELSLDDYELALAVVAVETGTLNRSAAMLIQAEFNSRLGAPPPPGTAVQLHHWAGQLRVLAADGAPLGTLQGAPNPGRAGLMRAQVSQDVGRVDVTYLGPDDLAGA